MALGSQVLRDDLGAHGMAEPAADDSVENAALAAHAASAELRVSRVSSGSARYLIFEPSPRLT